LLLAFFVILFILFPLFAILRQSVMGSKGFGLNLPVETLARYPALWRVLWNSLGLAIFVSVTSTFIGLAFALAAARSQSRFTTILRGFSLLPIITPPFVIGMAIILLFGLQGFVTSQLLGLKTRGIFGFPGLALAQTLSFAPVAFLVIASVVESINPALEEASVTLRASFAMTIRRVILPLIRPAILSALVFSFVRAVTAISAVVFLVSAKWQLSTKVILDQAENGRYGLATAYSTVLIVIMAAAIALMYVLVGKTTIRGSVEGGGLA